LAERLGRVATLSVSEKLMADDREVIGRFAHDSAPLDLGEPSGPMDAESLEAPTAVPIG
jgi:hypothetical protein